MKLEFRDGLIFTSIQVVYKGRTKEIQNVVIDTGAAETIISPDIVEDLGVIAEPTDKVNSFYGVGGSLHNFFTKKVDEVILAEEKLSNIKVDFGMIDPRGYINGLLGLDLLMKIGAVIDLNELTIRVNK
ncbi:retroviral-like aspartic protease family protein [Alkaliphilus peptidifermentans]|uniref:Aspartyl protease n=1 Tax=Alkaliphilus peptidifermentans DSM 18978 TaxID=1120976 RepID=A0A1G5LDF5_9FIRM|nr:retroviral-like aspartic protease family protein [Alkaliphilus peptidifermentans]SCZ10836.1 Aspartyl protease [Alkaliphilus peptidifermentans DSM 18978]